jgi:hypothetical protein
MGRYRTQAQWKEHYKKQKLNKEKMGLNKENSNASATFLGIKEGSFTKGTGDDKVKLDDMSLSGVLAKVEKKEISTQDGKQHTNVWFHVIDEGGEVFIVSSGVKSRYTTDLLNRLHNVEDLNQVIKIKPYDFESNEGKRYSGVSVYDWKGNKVDRKYTRENPCPVEPEVIEFEGQQRWSFLKQTDWFIDNLDLSVVEDKSSIDLPNSKSGTEVNPIDIIEDMKKKGDWEVSEKANSTEGTDDLPF